MGKRPYQRSEGNQSYKKRFILSTEGEVTEPGYFKNFDNTTTTLSIKILKSKHSSPQAVLEEMNTYLKKESLKSDDEAWLVVDKDQWSDEQLTELCQWCKEDPKHKLAVSNPKFEYWLLLHFEEGKKISSSEDCSQRLKKHLSKYKKKVPWDKVEPGIEAAIQRAKTKDKPPCSDWPKSTGTTVYRLVEKIRKK